MPANEIHCVTVWPARLRLSHWLLSAGVAFQLVSAWIIANTTADLNFWQDYHLIVGQLLILVVAFRAWLLFQQGLGHWRSFKTSRAQLDGAVQMLKFYASLFRFPLPSWFAYNPLWQMIYPLMLTFIALAVVSGALHDSQVHLLGHSAADIHAGITSVLATLVILHIATAVLQDWKGKGGSISALLNGNRYFHVEPKQNSMQPSKQGVEVHIPASAISKRPNGPR